MRAPLSWIRDFTPVDAPVADLVSALNQLGLEVEGVEQPGEEITGVIAAQVLEVVQHPNADKLSLVDITTGDGVTRVVCGAPNVVAGMVVPYAPAGATLPGGFTLERRKIRGEVVAAGDTAVTVSTGDEPVDVPYEAIVRGNLIDEEVTR